MRYNRVPVAGSVWGLAWLGAGPQLGGDKESVCSRFPLPVHDRVTWLPESSGGSNFGCGDTVLVIPEVHCTAASNNFKPSGVRLEKVSLFRKKPTRFSGALKGAPVVGSGSISVPFGKTNMTGELPMVASASLATMIALALGSV